MNQDMFEGLAAEPVHVSSTETTENVDEGGCGCGGGGCGCGGGGDVSDGIDDA